MNFEAVLCHWLPNWWTHKVMSACIYARAWSTFCDVDLRDRFMPVIVTVRSASSTHNISAACLLSDAWMCWDCKNRKNTRDIMINVIEAKHLNEMPACVGINRHKCKADVSCLCQYMNVPCCANMINLLFTHKVKVNAKVTKRQNLAQKQNASSFQDFSSF